jgi:aspartate-semialdehyde dehydrogenase
MQQEGPDNFIRDIGSSELHLRRKVPIAILGATSRLGQKLACLLTKHHWFTISYVCGPDDLAGRNYDAAVHWQQHEPIPQTLASLPLLQYAPELVNCNLVFSVLEDEEGASIEELFAKNGALVLSCVNSHHPINESLPILVPESHQDLLELPKKYKKQPQQGAIIVLRLLALENALLTSEFLIQQGLVFW